MGIPIDQGVALPVTAPNLNVNDILAKAQELEGVFLNTLVSEMFSGIKTDGMFGGGFGEETWRSMQSEQYANLMAQNGGIGLADQIVSEFLALQESAQATPQQQNTSGQGAYKS